MKSPLQRVLNASRVLFLGLLILPGLSAEEITVEALIEMARARVGSEEKLNGIEALRYVGVIEDEVKRQEGKLTMLLKKPLCQRLEIEMDGVHEVTAVNGYEGWIQRTRLEDGQSRVQPMNFVNVERMLNNTWENLNFFKIPKSRFGKSRYLGLTEHRGRQAHKMETLYSGGTQFIRFFDIETAELIATVTETDLEIVESGMIEVEGMKFPRKIESFKNGSKIHTIRFDSVEVNPDIEAEVFEYPRKRVTIRP